MGALHKAGHDDERVGSLPRLVGEEIGEAIGDIRVLGPHRGIETSRQAGLKLCCRQTDTAIAKSLMRRV